jgi:hypothetical protein
VPAAAGQEERGRKNGAGAEAPEGEIPREIPLFNTDALAIGMAERV